MSITLCFLSWKKTSLTLEKQSRRELTVLFRHIVIAIEKSVVLED